jgi:hypothetical protein
MPLMAHSRREPSIASARQLCKVLRTKCGFRQPLMVVPKLHRQGDDAALARSTAFLQPTCALHHHRRG